MRIGIYARKSIYSDKSDSVNNQVRMCKEYIGIRYGGKHSFSEYKDEGFTGANTNRPELKRLLNDIKAKNIDLLIIYQLDRLSRSVKDFSDIYAMLEENNIIFVSVKENVDTDTPIGRAMTMITMVFAQMERETIAERVTDNMQGLAKLGYWTGGNPPYGYERKRVVTDGKKHCTIAIVPAAAEYVKSLFNEFLEGNHSLSSIRSVYKKAGIKTVNGCFFSEAQFYRILTMPYCVPATADIYDYYKNLGCQMVDSRDFWDGSTGVMVYGRTSQKSGTHVQTKPNEWIVCKGIHQAFLDSEVWLQVQERFRQNTFNKHSKYPPTLLKGVIRCAKCGNLMRVRHNKFKDRMYISYYCQTRDTKGVEYCDMCSIHCNLLDDKVADILKDISLDDKLLSEYLKDSRNIDYSAEIKKIEKDMVTIEKRISNLTEKLGESEAASKYIIKQIESEDKKLNNLLLKLNDLKAKQFDIDKSKASAANKADHIKEIIKDFNTFTAEEKNEIAKDLISECTWDGDTLFLKF